MRLRAFLTVLVAFDAGAHDKSYESLCRALESAKHITSKVLLEEWGL